MDTKSVWTEFQCAVGSLPPQMRACYLLHDMFDISSADIAEMLGISPAACLHHVYVARRQIVLHFGPDAHAASNTH